MNRTIKVGSMLVLGLALTLGGGVTTTANAKASKARVLSTKNISKTIYHGKKGNIYSSAKLTKVRYKMKKYKYTTWYATKKATVKKNGKKASLTYIKAGKKKGWIYSHELIKGKAPVNKQKILDNDLSSVKTIVISGSSDLQDQFRDAQDYDDLAYDISAFYGGSYQFSDLQPMRTEKKALLNIYDLFKNRLPGTTTQKENLATMERAVEDAPVEADWESDSAAQVGTFAKQLAGLIEQM